MNFVRQTSQNISTSIYIYLEEWKHQKNHESKPWRISVPSPKSRKYLYAKIVAYTVSPLTPRL